ncbi:MAG TPA: glutathione S-transferase family protein [Polyangiales bacterium]|nr:glutathione S-transferase family protein [Polyangiales bacterium]
MKLYFHPASPPSHAVMLFASEAGIPLDYRLIDLSKGEHRAPEYLAINPNGLVPVLEDGTFRLTESSAILKYLADRVDSPAYPKDLRERARVNEAMDWFNCNLYRDLGYGLAYPQLLPHHRRNGDVAQVATIEWGRTKTRAWLGVLDESSIGPSKPFLCGETVTLADYLGASIVTLLDVIRCDYSCYPNLTRWLSNVKALPSWAKVSEAFQGWTAAVSSQHFVAL